MLKERYVIGGEAALAEDDNHRHVKADQGLISPQTEQAVLRFAAIRPRLAQTEVASELLKQGVIVSHAAIAKIWKEYGLYEGALQ